MTRFLVCIALFIVLPLVPYNVAATMPTPRPEPVPFYNDMQRLVVYVKVSAKDKNLTLWAEGDDEPPVPHTTIDKVSQYTVSYLKEHLKEKSIQVISSHDTNTYPFRKYDHSTVFLEIKLNFKKGTVNGQDVLLAGMHPTVYKVLMQEGVKVTPEYEPLLTRAFLPESFVTPFNDFDFEVMYRALDDLLLGVGMTLNKAIAPRKKE